MKADRPDLTGRRILVVEDDYYLAVDSSEWLEQAGATVVGPAGTLDQVKGLLAAEPVDAAMIDINLGSGPTFEVAGALSEQGIPFLFATGYDQAAIPPQFGAVPRLEKPFSGHALVAAVAGMSAPAGTDIR